MYDALVAAHVLCAVVGFGAVALSGVYGALARKPQATGEHDLPAGARGAAGDRPADEVARYFSSRSWAEWLILPVPVLGAVALAMNPSKGDLADVWVLGGILVWSLAAALLVLVVRPAESAIRRGGDHRSAARRLMWSSIASDLLFVAALALMVTQPR